MQIDRINICQSFNEQSSRNHFNFQNVCLYFHHKSSEKVKHLRRQTFSSFSNKISIRNFYMQRTYIMKNKFFNGIFFTLSFNLIFTNVSVCIIFFLYIIIHK